MEGKQEIQQMRKSLRESRLVQGMALTPERERMLERDLVVVRIIGGHKGANLTDIKEQDVLPERLELKKLNYTPSRGASRSVSSVETYELAVPRMGCSLLAETIGEDGMIHVASEHGMNLGLLIARPRSPRMHETGHIVPRIMLSIESTVDGVPLIYGPGANSLIIHGENTFLDVIPGRVYFGSPGNITKLTEMLADKSKHYTGKPDMELVFVGEELPPNRELEDKTPKQLPLVRTRGISLGKTVNVNFRLDSGEFHESKDPRDTYRLRFVFD